MNNTTLELDDEDYGPFIEDFTEYHVAENLWKYVPPVLIVLGTVGNILTVVVLSRSSMRHSTTSLYLRVLAVVDIIVLNTGLMRIWLIEVIGVDIRTLSNLSCKIHVWVVYSSMYASGWLLVAVTLERVLSVTFPHTVKLRCTRKAAYAIIGTILVIFMAFSAHYFFDFGLVYELSGNDTEWYCNGLNSNYQHFEQIIWPWIDLALYSVIPSSILIISNFCIIRSVLKSDQRAKSFRTGSIQNADDIKSRMSMTLTLVSVSATYVFCTTPFCIYIIYLNVFAPESTDHTDAVMLMVWALVDILQYTNIAINFLLYCVTGTRFRREAMAALGCPRKIKSNQSSLYTSSSRIATVTESVSSQTERHPRNHLSSDNESYL